MVNIPISPVDIDSPRPGPVDLKKKNCEYPLKKRSDEIHN